MAITINQAPIELVLQPDDSNARVTQIIVEEMLIPNTRFGRVSQMPIEWIGIPSTNNARVSQMVIELQMIGHFVPPPAGVGMRVYEA